MTSFECGDLVRPCFHLRFLLSEMTVIQVTPASSCVIVVVGFFFFIFCNSHLANTNTQGLNFNKLKIGCNDNKRWLNMQLSRDTTEPEFARSVSCGLVNVA